jgi:hypothetical protein
VCKLWPTHACCSTLSSIAAADTHTYAISLGHRTLRRVRRDALLSSEAAAAADAAAAEEEMRLASEVRALPVSSLHARSDIPTRCTHPTRTQITLINTHPTRSLAPTHSIHTCLADSHHNPNITHACAPLLAIHTSSLTHAVAIHTPRFLHENCNDRHRSLNSDHMQVFPLTRIALIPPRILCRPSCATTIALVREQCASFPAGVPRSCPCHCASSADGVSATTAHCRSSVLRSSRFSSR